MLAWISEKRAATALKAAVKAKKQRVRQHRIDKERVKTRGERLREAQSAFNAFVRERDKSEPCISCQRHHQGQYHAGHYRTVGAAAHLRFDEANCHKQCAPCNNHLSGNLIAYRVNLVQKIGLQAVEALETNNATVKWSVEYINDIKATYKLMLKKQKQKEIK
jgi:hypothetical protein